jgi:electron transfer flavoprotein alpha subunit
VLAVIFARAGELPPDAGETITEAKGFALILGDTAHRAAGGGQLSANPGATIPAGAAAADAFLGDPVVAAARAVWWCDTGAGLQPGDLAARLAPLLGDIRLVILPGSADGRDLAPRLAAELRRPLLARAARAEVTAVGVRADLCRLDGQVVVPAEVDGPAVATLEPGTGILTAHGPPIVTELMLPSASARTGRAVRDPEVLEVLDADPATAELAEAPVVLAGGAGLAAGLGETVARAAFDLLGTVAAALGAVAGATRVATDAGWADHDRQIGTTGVTIAPRSYVAFGISGATQHIGGIGTPQHVVSVNTDPHCPMTALSGLGIVADARATLAELADRLGVAVPGGLRDRPAPDSGGAGPHPEEVRDDDRSA